MDGELRRARHGTGRERLGGVRAAATTTTGGSDGRGGVPVPVPRLGAAAPRGVEREN